MSGILKQYGVSGDGPTGEPEFEPVPEGVYDAVIDGSKIETTDRGFVRLSYTLQIIGGDMDGRLLFDNMYLTHEKSMVAERGHNRARAYSHAVGLPDAEDPAELNGCKVRVTVVHRPGNEGRVFVNITEVADPNAPAVETAARAHDDIPI